MSMNQMEFAEFQFRVALRVSFGVSHGKNILRFWFLKTSYIFRIISVRIFPGTQTNGLLRRASYFVLFSQACRSTEQYSLIALNLCVVYIRMGESRKAKVDEYKRQTLKYIKTICQYFFVQFVFLAGRIDTEFFKSRTSISQVRFKISHAIRSTISQGWGWVSIRKSTSNCVRCVGYLYIGYIAP